ncbi:MAG TPA: phospho-sugar mutase, partial [Candidatus Faecivivens stercoripullorum]|nr:phospho-sugar mutase [Candidatus Faecivivens stercoripullorum]
DDCIESFYQDVLKCSLNSDVVASSGFKIVYSPLNGAGNKPVREILKRIGIKEEDLTIVPEQEYPDGNFPTCPYPNPEIRQALELGLQLCIKTGSDLMLATDPDCDRVGIAVKTGDDYKLLTGNEVGALMLYYIASQRKALGKMPKDPICIKTIVTTDLTNRIAEEYGVEVREILTGFKYIGEQIGLLEEAGEVDRYILGFEESYGYLAGPHVRDKDAVCGSMMICEMAAFYATQGKSLVDVLDELYAKYGYYLCTQQSFAFEGESGMNEMNEIMAQLQASPLQELDGEKVVVFKDYKAQTVINNVTGEKSSTGLPKSSVLSYTLENGNKFIIRPSGTEPKIKFYFFVLDKDEASARAAEKVLAENCTKLLKK